jgi:hypothetical protein
VASFPPLREIETGPDLVSGIWNFWNLNLHFLGGVEGISNVVNSKLKIKIKPDPDLVRNKN